MQGVIKSYDPRSKVGVLIDDASRTEHELALDALEGSILRMLRQGQRVIYELDEKGLATKLRLGSEVDLGTPDWIAVDGGGADGSDGGGADGSDGGGADGSDGGQQ